MLPVSSRHSHTTIFRSDRPPEDEPAKCFDSVFST